MPIPVYVFTGFLDAGKTKFIQETLEDPRFNAGERTLLLAFEEGEEEYDLSAFPKKNVYLEAPVYDKASNSFGILRYDFNKRILQAIAYKPDEESVEVIEEISLSEIDDLMNIRLIESPFMIVRNSMEENDIEFLAPKRKIYLEENESIEFVENEKMYSSKWNEDLLDVLNYGYGEEVIVRDLETGKILERYKGYLNRMPDGTAWLMTE